MQEGVVKYYSKKNITILVILFLFTTFSGAIRKWGVDSNLVDNMILAVQLIIPFCIGFCVGIKPPLVAGNKMFVLMLTYFIYLVFTAFNSMNPTIFHGLSGIIIHFGFWFAIYTYVNNRDVIPVERFLYVFSAIAVAELLLALIQYSLPGTHVLNRYVKMDDAGVAMVGTSVRVTGTFSYLGGFTGFIVLVTLMICTFIKLNAKPLIVTIAIAFTLVACFISGSRGITGFFIVTVLGFIALNYRDGRGPVYIIQIALISLLGFFLNSVFSDPLQISGQVETSYENFEMRVTQGRGEGESRMLLPVTELFNYEGHIPFFGIGLGACYQGVNSVLGKSSFFDHNPEGEVETIRTMIEGGPILIFFKLLLYIALVLNLKIDKRFSVLLCVLIVFTTPIVYNIYNAFYFFLGLILLDKAYYMEEQKNLKGD